MAKKQSRKGTAVSKINREEATTSVEAPQPSLATPPVIHVFGEFPIVEEFATLCAEAGYTVHLTPNDPEQSLTISSPRITKVSSVTDDTIIGVELTNLDPVVKRKNLEILDKALPATAPILSSSVTITATEQATWILQKHRLMGISALPTLLQKPLVEIAPTLYTPNETVSAVSKFFYSAHKEIEIVQDRIGMVFPRILCQLINEAAFAMTDEIASPEEYDQALKIGLGFPFGPIEWADRIGLNFVYAVVDALHRDTGEQRYRPAPLLRQMSLTGAWWKRPLEGGEG